MDKKYGWLTKRQGQNLNTSVPTQVFIYDKKVLLMLDLNCLRSHELCLHTLVKWLYKLTIETPNVYVTKHRKLNLQHFRLPDSFTS